MENVEYASNESNKDRLRDKLLNMQAAIDSYHAEHHGNAEGLGFTEGAQVVSKDFLKFIENADETLMLVGNEKRRLLELEQMFLQGKLNGKGNEGALEEFLGYFERYESALEQKNQDQTGH